MVAGVVADCDWHGISIGIRAALLMGWPWALNWLTGDLEVLSELWPCPNRWALASLGRVLDQCIKAWISTLMTG